MNDQKPVVSVNIMGGLGNQMFQVATAYSYAKQQNGNLKILPDRSNDDNRKHSNYWDTVLVNFKQYLVKTLPENMDRWCEKQATLYEPIPQLPTAGMFLEGYYQSSKYFIKEEIKNLFRPEPTKLHDLGKKYENLIKNKDKVVVVHARRTDYLRDGGRFHGPLSVDYYKEAIREICKKIQNPIFLLTSDDSAYWPSVAKKINAFQNNQYHILNENEVNSLILLQQFFHYIIANSTFSWWFVWLSEAKTVYAPKHWFGPAGFQNNEDIYEPDWIRI